jgi:cell division septation protein DedD
VNESPEVRTNVTDEKPTEGQPAAETPPSDYATVDRFKGRVNDSLGKRPLTVYLVLFAGAATLLLLLGVVWISSRSGDDNQELICTEIAPADARTAVLAGEVARINVLVDTETPTQTLTGIQLRFTDGGCRQTPQGADIREALFSVIGAVELFNHYGEQSVDIQYQAQSIAPELLATSTNTAEPTLPPTETPTSSPTVPATETPTVAPDTATPTQPAPTIVPASNASPDSRAPIGDPAS